MNNSRDSQYSRPLSICPGETISELHSQWITNIISCILGCFLGNCNSVIPEKRTTVSQMRATVNHPKNNSSNLKRSRVYQMTSVIIPPAVPNYKCHFNKHPLFPTIIWVIISPVQSLGDVPHCASLKLRYCPSCWNVTVESTQKTIFPITPAWLQATKCPETLE